MSSITPDTLLSVEQTSKPKDTLLRIDPVTAQAASEWFVLLASGTATVTEKDAWRTWLDSDSRNAAAWERIQTINAKFGVIPPNLGFRTLGEPRSVSRRKSLQAMALLMTAGGTGALVYRQLPWDAWSADYQTATGEIKEFTIADGTQLVLNTASSVDVKYTETIRFIRLHAGEMLVTTGHKLRADGSAEKRPLIVVTDDGNVRAIGTRFTVMKTPEQSSVSVYEGAVEISPQNVTAHPKVFNAGQAASFSQSDFFDEQLADERAIAWTEGIIVADGRYLHDFVRELNRHRPGILRCDPRIENLRVSGVFSLNDMDGTLAAIADAFPVRLKYRTRYWVTIEPA